MRFYFIERDKNLFGNGDGNSEYIHTCYMMYNYVCWWFARPSYQFGSSNTVILKSNRETIFPYMVHAISIHEKTCNTYASSFS